VFESLEADPSLDLRQQALLVELRKLVPKPGSAAAPRAPKAARGSTAARSGRDKRASVRKRSKAKSGGRRSATAARAE
jgi:hypothetical protein